MAAILDYFNTQIDRLNINNAAKDQIKSLGINLYSTASKEAILHFRKHLDAVVKDQNEDEAKREKMNSIKTEVDTVLRDRTDEAWWLSIIEPVEPEIKDLQPPDSIIAKG